MEKAEKTSNAETFSRRSGTLISIEFTPIGEVKSVRLALVRYKDLMLDQEEKALRFEYDHYNEYADFPDTKIGVIDRDELEGLIKSLMIIKNSVYLTSPANYTEVNFTSRSGFKAGCYYDRGDWKFYLQLSEYDSDSSVFMKKEDLSNLLNLLTDTQEKLLTA